MRFNLDKFRKDFEKAIIDRCEPMLGKVAEHTAERIRDLSHSRIDPVVTVDKQNSTAKLEMFGDDAVRAEKETNAVDITIHTFSESLKFIKW